MNRRKEQTSSNEAISLAFNDRSFIPTLLDTLSSGTTARFKAAGKLALIAEAAPELLYPHFNKIAVLLDSKSSVLLWNAIIILAHLNRVDDQRLFNTIIDKYYSHLWDGKLVTAANIIGTSCVIAGARQDLRERIMSELFEVDRIPLPTDECREVIRGHALVSLIECIDFVRDDPRALDFARNCLRSSRDSTRRNAERLIKLLEN